MKINLVAYQRNSLFWTGNKIPESRAVLSDEILNIIYMISEIIKYQVINRIRLFKKEIWNGF
jgi:hypothetical protein